MPGDDIHARSDRMAKPRHAVILAGGRGTRLRPYTVTLPKPLVPVADMPILEIIIHQLVAAGFSTATIAVNHQADLIRAYFGDGSKWGIALSYSLEQRPLGTMGPLRLIGGLPEHFLVMNGDVLTDLALDRFLDAHVESGTLFSISAAPRTQSIDFGVLHVGERGLLTRFEEKPQIPYMVSMGVYGVSRDIVEWIPADQAFGFDQLMNALLAQSREVRVCPHAGFWRDIGRPDDYQDVCEQWPQLAPQLLPMHHA
jgi:NDP-sugar pyrophosphorylase family protein